jgi:kynurenine formamidase
VGYPSPVIRSLARLPANGRFSLEVTTSMHVGTHIDAPNHFVSGGADVASLPLELLFGEGVVVDISDLVREWDEILPEHIESRVEIRDGDIVIVHTGWHRYFACGSEPNEERYMCEHPGGYLALARWIVARHLRWIGFDLPGADHPMNTTIRDLRPDLVARFEARTGRPVEETFPREFLAAMHTIPFAAGIVHAENVGGDIAQVLNRRLTIGAFPWRFVGGDASICRIVAFMFE